MWSYFCCSILTICVIWYVKNRTQGHNLSVSLSLSTAVTTRPPSSYFCHLRQLLTSNRIIRFILFLQTITCRSRLLTIGSYRLRLTFRKRVERRKVGQTTVRDLTPFSFRRPLVLLLLCTLTMIPHWHLIYYFYIFVSIKSYFRGVKEVLDQS